MSTLCPCCSGLEYSLCCGRWLSRSALPPDPETLMRSRYVAWVKQDVDWLQQTWHPTTRPAGLAASLAHRAPRTDWLELKITECKITADKQTGYVTFVARYAENQKPGFIYERSRFLREDQRWYYIDGTFPAPGRNEHCLCGSGKKYKRCCGR